MEKFLKAVGTSVIIVVALAGVSLLMAFPTKWVVNYLFNPTLLATIFTTGHLTVWHAWALNFAASTLIKSQLNESK